MNKPDYNKDDLLKEIRALKMNIHNREKQKIIQIKRKQGQHRNFTRKC